MQRSSQVGSVGIRMRGRPLQAPPPPLIPGSLSFGPLICSSRTPAQALRIPVIPKAGRKLRQDPGPLLRLPQQQPSRVAGDRSPVKPPPHLMPAHPGDEIRSILGYTVGAKGCPLSSLTEGFLAKILMPERDSLFQFLGENCGLEPKGRVFITEEPGTKAQCRAAMRKGSRWRSRHGFLTTFGRS